MRIKNKAIFKACFLVRKIYYQIRKHLVCGQALCYAADPMNGAGKVPAFTALTVQMAIDNPK